VESRSLNKARARGNSNRRAARHGDPLIIQTALFRVRHETMKCPRPSDLVKEAGKANPLWANSEINKSEKDMIDSRNFHDSVRRAGRSVVVIAAGIVWALCLPYQVSAQGGFDGPGRYEIANLKSGKVLDMDRNDQTSVMQFSSRAIRYGKSSQPATRAFTICGMR